MTNFESIELEIDVSNSLAIVCFNRPNQFNAFNIKFMDELITAFNTVSRDTRIKCLILTGRGKAFSAGGDVVEFKNAEKPDEFMANLVSKLHEGIKILKNMKILSIAAINGACFGAGLGYATACDFRISSKIATFGCAFTKIGLSPDSSSTWHLPKLVGLSLANEMLFLNRVLDAQEALQFSLVNKVINSEGRFLEEVKKFAAEICQGAPLAYSFTKKLIKASYTNDLETHLDKEAENIVKSAGTEDFQEGLKAFFEKRNPRFKDK
ncbi:MAG: enoyl-CoA hydratase/isomerase family protein [Candidatus Lokiarchaeota archaeon]|nr:enoyl-CoA hydratase/isomerase family protein [Candidatus Lokiarchaeota archaeon]